MRPPSALTSLAGFRPEAAVGTARRLTDGREADAAAFLFLGPARWRVRHRTGEEIVVVGDTSWTRAGPGADWERQASDDGSEPHHNGYLKALLFPHLLPAVSDPGSVVVAEEWADDGSARLTVRYEFPEPGSMVLDVAPAGFVSRIEGTDGDSTVVLLMDARLDPVPDSRLFDPAVAWDPDI